MNLRWRWALECRPYEVFGCSTVGETWNGRAGHTGDLMNPGVFVYIAEIEFQDGSRIAYRGDITLMR